MRKIVNLLPVTESERIEDTIKIDPLKICQINRIRELLKDCHDVQSSKKTITDSNGVILAIDSDPINLHVIDNYFSGKGYLVVKASNGSDALRLIGDSSLGHLTFDLVLLDLTMPQKSGYEICRKIREFHAMYELPVIFLTTTNGAQDLLSAFEAGGNDYVTKPINKEELLMRSETLIKLKKTIIENHQAKYKLLQDRMKPHFLFNSLNTIFSLISINSELAASATLRLAENFRFIVNHACENVIPFNTEWEFVNNYLRLYEIIYTNKISYKLEQKGDFSDILIPPLTIQPIVENSIHHGFHDKNTKLNIKVLAETHGNNIIIEVYDDGSGLHENDFYPRSLENILQRLQLYFKTAKMEIYNREGSGVQVKLHITRHNDNKNMLIN